MSFRGRGGGRGNANFTPRGGGGFRGGELSSLQNLAKANYGDKVEADMEPQLVHRRKY